MKSAPASTQRWQGAVCGKEHVRRGQWEAALQDTNRQGREPGEVSGFAKGDQGGRGTTCPEAEMAQVDTRSLGQMQPVALS